MTTLQNLLNRMTLDERNFFEDLIQYLKKLSKEQRTQFIQDVLTRTNQRRQT